MSQMKIAEGMAERLRREPYHLLWNDCLIKAVRLKRQCRRHGIRARVVACIGLGEARIFGRWRTVPVVHGWGEVEGKRLEVSRPLGSSGICGIIPRDIKPIIAIRL